MRRRSVEAGFRSLGLCLCLAIGGGACNRAPRGVECVPRDQMYKTPDGQIYIKNELLPSENGQPERLSHGSLHNNILPPDTKCEPYKVTVERGFGDNHSTKDGDRVQEGNGSYFDYRVSREN